MMTRLPDQRDDNQRICVTGATGYIGGRLVPHLLEAGFRVRCLVRSRRKLEARHWIDNPRVEVVEVDVAHTHALTSAMRDCSAAYYLVHSMVAIGREYREHDRTLALSFAKAAQAAGVERIIYLGGLGETGRDLSRHLASRREVEVALASTEVPVTVLRAAMIIGSGSASFEILRYLVERLPVMVTPRWVHTQCQPIAVGDVLHYLVASLQKSETTGQTIDIGGPDVMTYRQLMDVMSDALGLARRIIVPVPVLTPRLSSLWIHIITPISHRIARPLAEGLRNRVVCRNDDARNLMPRACLTVREAIEAAIDQSASKSVETTWADSGPIPGDPDWAGGRVFVDQRTVTIPTDVHRAFAVACRIGGHTGYFGADTLWHLRGAIDRLVGGPGLRRGRRHPEHLAFGDAVDFWRVTDFRPDDRLELRAEMRLPGQATLTFQARAVDDHTTTLTQTARFKPRGLFGLVYWYALSPLHRIVFNNLLQGIAKAASTGNSPVARPSANSQPQHQSTNDHNHKTPDPTR